MALLHRLLTCFRDDLHLVVMIMIVYNGDDEGDVEIDGDYYIHRGLALLLNDGDDDDGDDDDDDNDGDDDG